MAQARGDVEAFESGLHCSFAAVRERDVYGFLERQGVGGDDGAFGAHCVVVESAEGAAGQTCRTRVSRDLLDSVNELSQGAYRTTPFPKRQSQLVWRRWPVDVLVFFSLVFFSKNTRTNGIGNCWKMA